MGWVGVCVWGGGMQKLAARPAGQHHAFPAAFKHLPCSPYPPPRPAAVMSSDADRASKWARSVFSSASAVDTDPRRVEPMVQVQRGGQSRLSCEGVGLLAGRAAGHAAAALLAACTDETQGRQGRHPV